MHDMPHVSVQAPLIQEFSDNIRYNVTSNLRQYTERKWQSLFSLGSKPKSNIRKLKYLFMQFVGSSTT